jgi:hypothetical protein
MGRVGSTAINQTLHDNGITAHHAHWLSGKFPEAEFETTKLKILRMIQAGETQPLKIITPVREPMARNLSAFIFSLIKYGVSGRQETVEELQTLFLEKYNYAYPDLWFEHELLHTFNFSPFEEKFNHKRGYNLYKINKHRLLILRLEDADRVLPTALRKLLGVRGIQMIHGRSLEDAKYIGEKYKQLKNIKYPKDYVDKVYDLTYVKHFYTEEEIVTFKQKWSE